MLARFVLSIYLFINNFFTAKLEIILFFNLIVIIKFNRLYNLKSIPNRFHFLFGYFGRFLFLILDRIKK